VPLFFFFVCFRVASGFSPAAVGHPPFSGSSFASHSQSHSQRRSSSAKVRSDGSDKTTGEEGGSYAEALASAKSVLWRAAATKKEESDSVVAALLSLEQAARRRASEDPSSTEELTRRLDGSWRLCFTTGTIDQQKKSGRINYFPLKAIQSFDFEAGAIENGIYVGDAAVLKFSGPFDFDLKSRKLEFDFDTIRIFGFPISLGNKGAAAFGEKNRPRLQSKPTAPRPRETTLLPLDRRRRTHRHRPRRRRRPRPLGTRRRRGKKKPSTRSFSLRTPWEAYLSINQSINHPTSWIGRDEDEGRVYR